MKKIASFTFLFVFLLIHAVKAEFYPLHVGDAAIYTITQNLISPGDDDLIVAKSSLSFIIKILAKFTVSEMKLPTYIVEVTIKKAFLHLMQNDLTYTLSYQIDSNNLTDNLPKWIGEIDKPFVYEIDELTVIPLNSEESEMLTHVLMPYLKDILPQLVHIDDQNITLENPLAIETRYCQFAYHFNNFNLKKIKALFSMNILEEDDEVEVKSSSVGKVSWQIAQPLLQNRSLSIVVERKDKISNETIEKCLITQTWISEPLIE